MANPEKSYEAADFGWLVAMSFVFLALVAFALWREARPKWRPIQAKFQTTLQKYAGVEKANAFHSGIKQIWIPKIQLVDRCTTCHLGYDWGTLLPATLGEPLAPHPNLPYMDKHPFQQYGCTTCHGGQGWATTADAAHGDKDWDDPMLSAKLADRCGLTRGDLMQLRCNFCHRHDVATPGMEQINLGKKLYKARKCVVCHTVEGRGGATAPELTYYGDKDSELFDFSNVTGARTLFNWNYQHLMTPDKVSPHTSMPTYNFQPAEARALTLLLLSWRRQIFPPEYVPAPIESVPTAAAAPTAAAPTAAAPGAAAPH
ncbi:MAG TPA: cytochrome c [Candidatus Acidoferrales bacterium]|nr:cytochrome c [Candidatus Acidoferrales bacterium]